MIRLVCVLVCPRGRGPSEISLFSLQPGEKDVSTTLSSLSDLLTPLVEIVQKGENRTFSMRQKVNVVVPCFPPNRRRSSRTRDQPHTLATPANHLFTASMSSSIVTYFNDTIQQIEAKYGTVDVAFAIAANMVLIGGAWYYLMGRRRGPASSRESSTTTTTNTPKARDPTSASISNRKSGPIKPPQDEQQLRNVFSVKQKPPISGTCASSTKKHSSERPFGSSYYYAHNNSKSKGGYKDGLKAEDYVMNGPKLLSKGGVRVDNASTEVGADGDDNTQQQQDDDDDDDAPSSNITTKKSKPKLVASTCITRYLWDDDGEGHVAKIHIDTLPLSSTQTIQWQEASISKEGVEVRLIGEANEGLFIGITDANLKKYHLSTPKMYGEAESVTSIVKKHKLLIKITKKKIPRRYSNRHSKDDGGVWGSISTMICGNGEPKEEFVSVAWPRLNASASFGLGGGTTEIDEKLFRKDVSKKDEEFLFT